MGAKNKRKGTLFEYHTKWALQMLCFYVIRAYSSVGVADLVATPPWNPRKNIRPLLIQCKNSKTAKDYVRPFERDHLEHLQQINAGNVVLFYKDGSTCMVKRWATQEKSTFNEFIQKEYGIPCDFKTLIKDYQEYRRPIHLYAPPKLESGQFAAAFQDFYAVNTKYHHIPEKYKHL